MPPPLRENVVCASSMTFHRQIAEDTDSAVEHVMLAYGTRCENVGDAWQQEGQVVSQRRNRFG